jgi:ribosome-associated protein
VGVLFFLEGEARLAAKKSSGGSKSTSKSKSSSGGAAKKDGPRLRSSMSSKTDRPRIHHAKSPVLPVTAPQTPKAGRKGRSSIVTDGPSQASPEGREIAIAVAVAALEKKAAGLEILDVAGKVDYADFLVLMTGRSDRQVAALSQGIEDALAKLGKRALSVEGMPSARWVLMDFGDVVVHVFQEDARDLYDLEGLWMDARRIPVPIENNIS